MHIALSTSEEELLQHIQRKRSIPEFQKQRVQIVLAAANGLQNKEIAANYALEVNRIGLWRKRWATQHQLWKASSPTLRPAMTESLALQWLADKPGRGRKERITADQRTKIVALARETPEQNGLPITHWARSENMVCCNRWKHAERFWRMRVIVFVSFLHRNIVRG